MDPNITPPSSTPNGPVQPTGMPPQPGQMGTPPFSPEPKKKWPMLVLVIVVLAALGVGAYFLFAKEDTTTSTTTNSNSQNNTAESTTTNSITNAGTSTTLTVTHPESWKVDTTPSEFGDEQLTVTSDEGNYLYMTYNADGLGVGGSCDSDDYSYTLVKKIPTQDPTYFFTEYTTKAPDRARVGLSLEPFASASAEHKTLAEGKSNTGVCDNLAYYSMIGDIFVYINATSASGQSTSYDTIKDDAAFIDMLESLDVTTTN